jgi:hypothetical protein
MLSRTSFLVLCFLCYSGLLFSQTTEGLLLKNICEDVIKQNSYFLMKRKLTGFVIVADPVNGRQVVKPASNATPATLEEFNRYSKDEQIEILGNNFAPIFPTADTVFVIDTLNFFSEGAIYAKDQYYFKVKRKATSNKRTESCINLYAVGMRGNSIILSFSFKKSNELLNYYFNIKQDAVSLIKTSILSKTPSIE